MSMQTAENSADGSASVNTAPVNPSTVATVPLPLTREVRSGTGSAQSAPKSSGDGAAAVNTASRPGNADKSKTGNADRVREKSSGVSGENPGARGISSGVSNETAKDESDRPGENQRADRGGMRLGYIDKPTPKSTSEAINRATERYRKKIEEYEQREKRVAELLKSAGITGDLISAGLNGDLETDVSQILTNARKTPTEAAIRSGYAPRGAAARDATRGNAMRDNAERGNAAARNYAARDVSTREVSTRDHELLGNADADEIIKGGDIDAELKRLEDKPVPQRTRRDRQCYLRLMNERQSRRDLEALGKLGVDVEKLKKDGAFAEFDNSLNPDIPVAERYELFKKYCVMRKAVKPPMSASSRGNTPRREYFDSDVIDGMSREEIANNLDAITRSMKSW